MHLTSTPNTIQTEIGLASAATIQRAKSGPSNPNGLICCAQYGQIYRNSDPHIGALVNGLVAADSGMNVTLTNPPGLYIQEPNWGAFETPDKTSAETFWTIERGTKTLEDEWGQTLPGNFILHASFAVPQQYGYTVSDIKIGGVPIQWGGQFIRTITMQLLGTGVSASVPKAVPCVGNPDSPLAQPLQLFHAAVFDAMNAASIANPVGVPMTLVSNSTLIPPRIQAGALNVPMILTANTLASNYAVTFDDPNITGTVTGSFQANYAVPGNTYPGPVTAIKLQVTVNSRAATGLHGAYITNQGQSKGQPMPALLIVGPSS